MILKSLRASLFHTIIHVDPLLLIKREADMRVEAEMTSRGDRKHRHR